MIKRLLLLSISLIALGISSCDWTESPNTYSFSLTNASSYSFRVDFSTILSTENTLQIGRGQNRVKLLDYTTEDEFEEPNEDKFSSYINSMNLFVGDSLVYTQDPVVKQHWELYDEITDDGFTQYYYSLTIVDSMLSIPWLELIQSYSIDVEEPSGLDLAENNNTLWTVSDKNNKIYRMDLTGRIIKEISVPGSNLEGITVNKNDNTLWVVQELLGEILQVDTLGNEIQRISIPGVRDGGGLEGITFNTTDNHIFLIKENNPSALIELNTDFETVRFNRISSALDYSGIDYNEIENELWIVSDQNKEVFRYDMSGKVLDSYLINVNKAEGIAFDEINNKLYIVSDSADSLFVYKYNAS